ncbi:hypothetical protein B6N60_03059 [Richelia sinica FACHB-800]|uniref:Alpha/beta hydrolase n=1 Tax=Richelia sinica FACHB-800 TaxID=1357546 RepID=A0A975T970_9NOST|nr:hypothetical protein [Richelia sinica]MBD2665002.1 hypothetical protein [Richelia sinica FACHB-800]QXE24354.1 hypothetical protein B6N60_03059 [Richelia sinica FACHB-800]
MIKDYVLFLHGVNVRESKKNEARQIYGYADDLFNLIKTLVYQKDLGRNCIKVPLYWGDVNQDALAKQLSTLQASSQWQKLWFQDFRQTQLLQFVGDAALYISRLIGSLAAEKLQRQAFERLADSKGGDRLHLVTHSWGTVILFDLLFANRWDNPDILGHDSVQAIRDKIYGIGKHPEKGIRLASIHTMGSPIALFSLITISGKNANNESTHDISPGLEKLLQRVVAGDRKLPWLNFIHPGDPIAWPLETIMTKLINGSEKYVQLEDVITRGSGVWELIAQTPPLRQTFLALVNGGNAHGSYWQNKDVARRIASNILSV